MNFTLCRRRKMKANVGKSKMMVYEMRDSVVVDFAMLYRI